MAECPKCHHHLTVANWKQKCKYCGANIVLYDLQERLMQDADKAEVQHYHFQKKIDRLKASFVGSKLAITRIITSLLPIAGLFVPLCTVKHGAFSGKVDFMAIYNNISNVDIGGLFSDALPLGVAFGALLLSVVALLFHFILLILACSPKAKVRAVILNGLMLGLTVASIVSFSVYAGSASGAKLGIGAFVYLALMIVNSTVDFLTLKQGISVTHKQCYCGGIPIEEYFEMVENGATHDEIRAEQYKRLGELQTQKEREIAEKEASESGR